VVRSAARRPGTTAVRSTATFSRVASLVLLVGFAVGALPPESALGASPGLLACTVTDGRLAGLTGLASRGGMLLAVSDLAPAAVYELDADCRVTGERRVSGPVVDLEGLAVTPDGSAWLADIGGRRGPREEIALVELSPDAKSVTRYRLRYPDGPHDAQALALTVQRQVLVITTSSNGTSGVYAAGPPVLAEGVMQLERVAEVDLSAVPGRSTVPGATLVTGAAVSPDGTRLALRTYSDVFEWDAPDTDLLLALREREPVLTRLPPTGQGEGEAMTYRTDGRTLLVGAQGHPSPLYQVSLTRGATPAAALPVPPRLGWVGVAALCLLALISAGLTVASRFDDGR